MLLALPLLFRFCGFLSLMFWTSYLDPQPALFYLRKGGIISRHCS